MQGGSKENNKNCNGITDYKHYNSVTMQKVQADSKYILQRETEIHKRR